MASNFPLNANIINCPPTNDDPYLVQDHVSLSKVHGEDGMVMEAQGAAESVFSPIILNANISNVHGCHDLSALLIESRLDGISEGVSGAAREDVSIHDTCSAHSWADCAEEGEFIPQAALDLEAKLEGFLEDLSFLMESFHGDSSSPSIRRRRSLNNGSHGSRGARGCPIKKKTGEHPLGNPWIHGREGGPSIGMPKAESVVGSTTFCPTMCNISDGAEEERPLGNSGNQGGGVEAVQDLLTATKSTFSDLKSARRGCPLWTQVGLSNRVDIEAENVANPMGKS
ncbi:hypothetical protein F0562_003377 [Nyssa sinensis]|uniref:Uncharacterized protein n=1 Tax=Nyssa sinensis TaxID=561372 RepID=A0A5J5BVV0_9ASTE|nr:hypothetical protein F0562_003377 [Nyssa sinensis]